LKEKEDAGVWVLIVALLMVAIVFAPKLKDPKNRKRFFTVVCIAAAGGLCLFGASTLYDAFRPIDDTAWRYLATDDGLAIVGYAKKPPRDGLVIPAELDGRAVTRVGYERNERSGNSYIGFDTCKGLTSVTIPASVSNIGRGAFDGCPGLTLTVMEGNYAEAYARENGIPYVYGAE